MPELSVPTEVPPYGDHAAWPVSSYRMTSTFGASCDALASRNASQSGVDLRISRSMVTVNGRENDPSRAILTVSTDRSRIGVRPQASRRNQPSDSLEESFRLGGGCTADDEIP